MAHNLLDLDSWIRRFPLAGLTEQMASKIALSTLSAPASLAYVEQIRSEARRAGADLGRPVPVDVCVRSLGDAVRRDVTKIGGSPYWPADEEWPLTRDGAPYTFVAQFCFTDSKDILRDLPGNILSILSAAPECQEQDIALHWFKLGDDALLRPEELPEPGWRIQPCHAILHRTSEYPEADFELFEAYPYSLCSGAKWFSDATKIGGAWELRGELPEPSSDDDDAYRRELENAWSKVRQWEANYVCQLASVAAFGPHPFVNVKAVDDLSTEQIRALLEIGDGGGLDFFCDGRMTECDWWSG
jgi:hypothetical protein